MASEGYKRKLTAILSADVVGYSKLMRNDEEATVRDISAYRILITEIIEQNRGRVIDSPGDNILAEFASVVDAVNGAIKIQEMSKAKNADVQTDRQMEFRIGINLGDVIEEGDHIYGDGVNIAARIEGFSSNRGIAVSGTVYEQIKNKLPLGYHFLGEQRLKNISEPVRIYRLLTAPGDEGKLIGNKKKKYKLKWFLLSAATLLLIVGLILAILYFKFWYLPTPENIDPDNKMTFDLSVGPSIAVLPFNNLTGNPNHDSLCDGFTDHLISVLAHVPELLIIARNSTFAYKGEHKKAQIIGKELGAQYIIEGSIQILGEQARIVVQLINAEDGHHKWSATYDKPYANLFKLQDEIAFEIVKEMQIKLTQGDKIKDIFQGIKDIKTYRKVLNAWVYYNKLNPEKNKTAQGELQEIIQINPNIPFVHNLLGMTYWLEVLFQTCENDIICFGKATESVREALSLDDKASYAHATASQIFVYRREYEKAINAAKTAITLNPNNAEAYIGYGIILRYCNQQKEALDYINKAITLDPIPPWYYYRELGYIYTEIPQLRESTDIKDYEKAIDYLKRSIEMEPNNFLSYLPLSIIYGYCGNITEASKAASELIRNNPNFSIEKFLKSVPHKNQALFQIWEKGLFEAGLK